MGFPENLVLPLPVMVFTCLEQISHLRYLGIRGLTCNYYPWKTYY